MRSSVVCLLTLCLMSLLLLLSGESAGGRCECAAPCEEQGYRPVCGREDLDSHTYRFPNECYMDCLSQCLQTDYKEIDMEECSPS